ncbi:hypothetical protein LCGC14_1037160 [marine sediment metagenome]|uniref:Uncharacterized protein n=1 Tax=marine sediment metagenome TaxID=412755 RepID=A0A0F9MSY2_9ZZZZ
MNEQTKGRVKKLFIIVIVLFLLIGCSYPTTRLLGEKYEVVGGYQGPNYWHLLRKIPNDDDFVYGALLQQQGDEILIYKLRSY